MLKLIQNQENWTVIYWLLEMWTEYNEEKNVVKQQKHQKEKKTVKLEQDLKKMKLLVRKKDKMMAKMIQQTEREFLLASVEGVE